MTESERVVAVGLTEQEAECWELSSLLAGKFFQLPNLHPMDDHEVAQAIHVIQNKLLGRPAYRKYLQLIQQQSTATQPAGTPASRLVDAANKYNKDLVNS